MREEAETLNSLFLRSKSRPNNKKNGKFYNLGLKSFAFFRFIFKLNFCAKLEIGLGIYYIYYISELKVILNDV